MTKWLFCTTILYAGLVTAAPLQKPCVDYYAVGPSPCDVNEVTETTPEPALLPPPVVETEKEHDTVAQQQQPAQPKPPPLEQRVDEFLENYEKPPREFVAFNLEPTMENALKWVKAYNDMLKRDEELTRAWMQAEVLYNQAEAEGIDLAAQLNYESRMPAVPDFGVPVDRGGLNRRAAPNALQRTQPNLRRPQDNNFQVQTAALQRPTAMRPPTASNNIGGGNIEITYYFSAECPYCQRFEPGFQKLIEENPGRFDVTCVDLTPSGATQNNINGKVDCAWRPPQPGEVKQMGIKSTPSLIVNRGAGQPLERVSGFVPPDRLQTFLLR